LSRHGPAGRARPRSAGHGAGGRAGRPLTLGGVAALDHLRGPLRPPPAALGCRPTAPGGTAMARARTAAKKSAPKLPPAEELLGHYRDMLQIRRFEEKAGQLYGMGLIGGFCHLYIGQEAVVVGLEATAEEG